MNQEQQKVRMKRILVERNLMDPEDNVLEYVQSSHVRKSVGSIGCWKPGWAYFTEKLFIYPTTFIEDDIAVPYRNIRRIRKTKQYFLPIGISITYEKPENGKSVTDMFSMMKREKWIELIAEKAGLTVTQDGAD